jgi:Ca-activated chloride channel family protein
LTHHFGFSSPYYLLVLLIVPLLLAFAWLIRRRRVRYTLLFTNVSALAGTRPSRRRRLRRLVPPVLIALALAATAAALARPHVELSQSGGGATIVLLADVSGSMQATDVKPARIYAAIQAMRQFVDALPTYDSVGLMTFSDRVKILAAPTTDHDAVRNALDVLSPEGGTALGAGVAGAVRVALASLARQGVPRTAGGYAPAAIVLESDGAQDRGNVTPLAAARLAKSAGIRIYGVAVGTPGGRIVQGTGLLREVIRVPPSPGTVRMLAQQTGGEAFTAADADRLNSIYRQLGSTVGRHTQRTDITSWFEAAAAVLLVCGVGAARLWGGALP